MSDRRVVFEYLDENPERLDKFLVSQMPDYTRSRLQTLIREGQVSINQVPAQKTGQQLECGMLIEVTIPPPEPTSLIPEAIDLNVLFENEDVIVVNKPAGMVVHPAPGHYSGTLVHAALAHAPQMEGLAGEKRPGVVHRLDKDTSGVILLAKNDLAHQALQNQFQRREVQKTYLALVDGSPPTPSGRIEAPIGRNPKSRKQMAVTPVGKGRRAISEYYTQEKFTQHTLLEVHPITGRTHQIRVHLAFIGCPIVGDEIYGRRKPSLQLDHHFLHANKITLTLPGESNPRTFEAPLPYELEALLTGLRQTT